jgi:RNA polymerase sigma factor (sigma-70 family)
MTSQPTQSVHAARNAALLAAYARSRSREDRNAVVRANLPLVWRVARQESQRSGHSFDDLCQEGCLGLIRAVERYEPCRGTTLSTAATPWIRGAMRHYLRDRTALISGSHHLLELHQRGTTLQRSRQQQGLVELGEPELASALGCSLERWQQAIARRRSLQLASLDQPQLELDGTSSPLVEQLPDPAPPEPYAGVIQQEQRRQLWQAIRHLKRQQRRLLLGRLLRQATWRELGQACGLSAKSAQRRGQQLLELMQQQLRPALEP